MKNLHTYMLPVAAGAFALMLSPIAETAAVGYSLIAIIVITGIIGLQSLAKTSETSKVEQQNIVKALEKLEAQSVDSVKETKQQTAALLEVLAGVGGSLGNLQTLLTSGQENSAKQMMALEEKVDEGNKVIESVSILAIKEIQAIVQFTEELISIQNMMPNELSALQDAITQNQQDLVNHTRNIEDYMNDLKNVTESHYEQSVTTHESVVEKIREEFDKVSTMVNQETSLLVQQASTSNEHAQKQLNNATDLLANSKNLNSELEKMNKLNNDTVNNQLKELRDISSALLQGIAQLTNSQSVERKQLLAIQKNLINKYAK